ncbi:MAG: bacteriohemerythrin [Bacillota bacterium]
MSIQWRQSYEIGLEEIDKQHRELFKKINDLLDACNDNKGREEVNNTIRFLGDYVVTHFNAEEKLQEKYSYPEYKSHKASHDQFVKDFGDLKRRLEDEGPTLQFVALVNRVVVDWLIKHIGNSDKAFGAFLKDK